MGKKPLGEIKDLLNADLDDPYSAHAAHTAPPILVSPHYICLSSAFGNNGTYPRLTRLANGAILCGFTRFQGPTRILQISRSEDNGRTFHDIGEVARSTHDCDNISLLALRHPLNHVLAAFRNHDLDHTGRPTFFRITVCRSQDAGCTWTFLSQVVEKLAEPPPAHPLGVWEPFLRLNCRGDVQITWSQEFAHDHQVTMMATSCDGGATWTPPSWNHGSVRPGIAAPGASPCHCRDGMTGVAETMDQGRPALVMVFETTAHGHMCVYAAVSLDDGQTWVTRAPVYRPSRPGRSCGAPQVASFADGSLATIFMCDEDAPNPKWPQHACVKVVFANPPCNGQLHWSQPQLVECAPSYWPNIFGLGGGEVMATYQHNGGPKAKVISRI